LKPISAFENFCHHQRSPNNGINGSALNAEYPLASMVVVIAMASATPRMTGIQ